MEPPPPPSCSGRFRLRVQIYPPKDAYNLNAVPLRQFTIVKTHVLALPDLTLRELCDEVVKRFEAIYPGESLFAIEKPQDSYGSDLYLGDRVKDVFEDNEIFRVIKGATIHASVEPHRERSQSVEPNGVFQYGSVGIGKRSNGHSEAEDLLRAQKRQRITTNEPDRPIRSRELDTVEREAQNSGEQAREATFIQDSQETNTEQGVNGVSHRITKYGQIASSLARESGSVDQQHSNPVITFSAPLQRIPTPPSGSISKDEAATSGSDVNSPRSRVISRSKRKLNLIEDFSEQDRGQSTSTAVTTPLSALQRPNHQSPIIDHKKLRRPTLRAGKNNTEDQQVARAPPRQNLYEVIETDSEYPSVKPPPQEISSKIRNSYKWKTYKLSTTPNTDRDSSRQRRSVLIQEKDVQTLEGRRMDHDDQQQVLEQEQKKLTKQQAEQERSILALEAAEKRRLGTEEKEKERQAKLESERVAAEKLQQDIEAKKAQVAEEAKAEAARQKSALAKAEAAKAAQLAEKAKLEAEAKARLEKQAKDRFEEEERAREASQADKLQLEMDALIRAEKENDLKEQAILQSRQENRQKSENLKASLEATVRRAATAPAKAATAQNSHSTTGATLEANGMGPASNAGPPTSSNKRVTCTTFIPRGKLSGFSPATLHPSQSTASSLPRVPFPNVGLEDQMPMPPQLKRKVSFVDQDPPAGRRSSSASSTLKQTTLVPPRLGITNVKSTAVKSIPKRTPLKANSGGSKSSKGKAKVVESPGKPPPPTIEISSDEESTTNSKFQHNRFKAVGSPGPACHKLAARQVSSPPKSEVITDVIELNVLEEHRHVVNERETEKTDKEGLLSLPTPHLNSINPFRKKICSTPEVTISHPRLSISPHAKPSTIKASHSQGGSSTHSYELPETVKTPGSSGSKQAELNHLETDEQSEQSDDDVEESDSTETPDDPKSTSTPGSVGGEKEDLTHLNEDQNEKMDDEVEEESDSSGDSQPANVPASARNRQDDSSHLKTETDNKTTDEEVEKDPDVRELDTEDETTDEELEQFSDAMQAQVDDQLLTQSFSRPSSLGQGSSLPNISGVLPQNKDVGLLQNHSSGRPSLRRMNLEAQRTREANIEAAKARGLQKAQKMRIGAKPSGLLEESSEEASSSELSSTSSEYETDEEEPVSIARSEGSSTDNIDESRGELNNEDVEEMSRKLLAKSGDANGPSSTRLSALKPPSRAPDLMFRPTSKLQRNLAKKDGKKSGKIGWAKLGKQFSASKQNSSG